MVASLVLGQGSSPEGRGRLRPRASAASLEPGARDARAPICIVFRSWGWFYHVDLVTGRIIGGPFSSIEAAEAALS